MGLCKVRLTSRSQVFHTKSCIYILRVFPLKVSQLFSCIITSSCARSARFATCARARCAHFVIAHFNYFVLWNSTSLAPTQHIYMMNTTVIAMGTVVPTSKVEGSWIGYQVYVIQHVL